MASKRVPGDVQPILRPRPNIQRMGRYTISVPTELTGARSDQPASPDIVAYPESACRIDTSDQNIDGTGNCSVQDGKSIPFAESINAAITECVKARASFFGGVNQTAQSLKPALSLYTLMTVGGDPVVDAVISHPDFPVGERAPQRNKPALLAVLLAARPDTDLQRKWCSDWANVLIEAGYAGVQPEAFADWAADITLKQCKAEGRKRRREEKVKSTNPEILDTAKLPTKDDETSIAIGASTQIEKSAVRLELRLLNGEAVVGVESENLSEKEYSEIVNPSKCHSLQHIMKHIAGMLHKSTKTPKSEHYDVDGTLSF